VELVVKGGTIITAEGTFRGDVGVTDGRIARLGEFPCPGGVEVVDATGKWVLPGVVDAHTHLEDVGDNGTPTADDFLSGTCAAAAGGITTIIDFVTPATGQPPSQAVRQRRRQAEAKAVVDFALHCCIPEAGLVTAQEAERLLAEGISSVKLFTAYAGLALDTLSLYQVMQRAVDVGSAEGGRARSGLTVFVHAENGEIIDHYRQRFAKEGKKDPYYHARSRPPFTELEAVARVLVLHSAVGSVGGSQARLCFAHVTTAAALDAIRQARRHGQAVFAETCPHYLLFDEAKLQGRDGELFIMSPPLRSVEDSHALWQGLTAGDLDIVSTDHCPFPAAAKRGRPFYEVASGVGSIELLLSLVLSEAVLKPTPPRLSPNRMVALLSTNPARIFGLYPRKGSLAPGADADLVVVDPAATCTVGVAALHGNEDHSIYEGMTLRGAVETTISRGEIIYHRGRVLARPGRGHFLHRPFGNGLRGNRPAGRHLPEGP